MPDACPGSPEDPRSEIAGRLTSKVEKAVVDSRPLTRLAQPGHSLKIEAAVLVGVQLDRLQSNALDLIGSSALHVVWGDGHMRSIYRYDFLRTIAPP